MFSEGLLYTTEQEIVIFSHEQLEKLINRESKANLDSRRLTKQKETGTTLDPKNIETKSKFPKHVTFTLFYRGDLKEDQNQGKITSYELKRQTEINY